MKGSKKEVGFKYAWAGLLVAFKQENNFRIHLSLTIIVLLFSFVLKLNLIEWLFVIIAIALVIITELINSVFERMIDYLKPEKHQSAKEIKDMSAAFVLIAAIIAIIIGTIIFLPKIIRLIL